MRTKKKLLSFALMAGMLLFSQNAMAYQLNASDVLGQPDFTTAAANITNSGFGGPEGITLDTVNHRLFVADWPNNRVLVFNLNANNLPLDNIADFVLGQPNFINNTATTTLTGLRHPTGIITDSANNRLYIADSGNGRILVYDLSILTNGKAASYTIGGLAYPTDMVLDSVHQRLFVSDTANNRIAIFDVSVLSNTLTPVNVLGQRLAPQNLLAPMGLEYDAAGNRLFVSDSRHNRVLIYNISTITDNQDAINVLGQTDFIITATSTSQGGMNSPRNLAYDSELKILYVADQNNSRILAFDVSMITNGKNAFNVLGQSSFGSATGATTRGGINSPRELAYDKTNKILYVTDNINSRVLIYQLPKITTASLPNATNTEPYTALISAIGGAGPYSCSIVSGALASGLTLNGCEVTGTPAMVGNFPFTVRVSDSANTPPETKGFMDNRELLLIINSAPTSTVVITATSTTAASTTTTSTTTASTTETTATSTTAASATGSSTSATGITSTSTVSGTVSSTTATSTTGTTTTSTTGTATTSTGVTSTSATSGTASSTTNTNTASTTGTAGTSADTANISASASASAPNPNSSPPRIGQSSFAGPAPMIFGYGNGPDMFGGFSISVKGVDGQNVDLMLNGGPDAKSVMISENSDFSGAASMPYSMNSPTARFILSDSPGKKTIYAKFFNIMGNTSPLLSTSIELPENIINNTPTNPDSSRPASRESNNFPADSTTLNQTIQFGFQGEQVKLLQDILKSINFFPENIGSTGYFGPITQKSVEALQRSLGLNPSGIVSAETLAVLNDILLND